METSPEPTQRFYAIAAAAIILLSVLFASYVFSDRRALLEAGEETARQIAEQTALVADGELAATRQLLVSMAILIRPPGAAGKIDPAAVRSTLLKLRGQNPYIMDLLVVEQTGRVECWTGNGAPPDVRDRSYFTAHAGLADTGLHVGPPLRSKVHRGRWFFALSEALRNADGTIDRILVTIVDVALLRDHIGVRMAIPDSSQSLISEAGIIYTRRPDHDLHVGHSVSRLRELSSLTANEPGLTIRTVSQVDGLDRILSYRRLRDFPLIATGSVLIERVLEPWQQRTAIVGAVFVALSLVILWIAHRGVQVNRFLSELASIDSLTGIFNRRSIISTASRLERSQEHVGSLSLLMVDIDHFKAVNDRFGHLVGDEVLRQVSHVLTTQCRGTDIVGRFGGEEFLVLMPDTGEEGARRLAEKLREAIESRVVQPVQVTISVGVATTSEFDQTLDRTLARADEALYAAKEAGRNCVRIAKSALPKAHEPPAGTG